jgi:hypothetical protein
LINPKTNSKYNKNDGINIQITHPSTLGLEIWYMAKSLAFLELAGLPADPIGFARMCS